MQFYLRALIFNLQSYLKIKQSFAVYSKNKERSKNAECNMTEVIKRRNNDSLCLRHLFLPFFATDNKEGSNLTFD